MKSFKPLIVTILVIAAITFTIIGPQGCNRRMSSWKAQAYGSNWIVLQFAATGQTIQHWVLINKSIGNELNSDGIYFTDKDGNVIHLSGHYLYVEVKDKDMINKVLSIYGQRPTMTVR